MVEPFTFDDIADAVVLDLLAQHMLGELGDGDRPALCAADVVRLPALQRRDHKRRLYRFDTATALRALLRLEQLGALHSVAGVGRTHRFALPLQPPQPWHAAYCALHPEHEGPCHDGSL